MTYLRRNTNQRLKNGSPVSKKSVAIQRVILTTSHVLREKLVEVDALEPHCFSVPQRFGSMRGVGSISQLSTSGVLFHCMAHERTGDTFPMSIRSKYNLPSHLTQNVP